MSAIETAEQLLAKMSRAEKAHHEWPKHAEIIVSSLVGKLIRVNRG
jgi:hypothetical protein